jgi:hypothetical protein
MSQEKNTTDTPPPAQTDVPSTDDFNKSWKRDYNSEIRDSVSPPPAPPGRQSE